MTDNETAIVENDEMIAMLEADLELARRVTNSDDWLPEWFMGRTARLKDAREAIKKRYREMMDHLDAEERALHYKWGKQFKQEIDDKLALQGGKKKSVNFLTGRAGYRASKGTIIIEDNQAAKVWAVNNLDPDELKACISSMNKTPLAEKVELAEKVDPDTGEIYHEAKNVPDGCRYIPAGDKFYPYPPVKAYLREGENAKDT